MKVSFVLPLLLVGAAGHASIAMAQSRGTFAPTGDMSIPRWGHSATLLPNGKVLIAGGSNQDPPGIHAVASAELYDPAMGTFAPTGSLITARNGHSATLLPNGKVLIAGGSGDASAELYDPSTGTFSATGSMTTVGVGTAARLLPDGRVFTLWIYGSEPRGCGGPFAASAELYDPVASAFNCIGIGFSGEYFPTSSLTLLVDGRLLLTEIGADIYDPGRGSLSRLSFSLGSCPEQKATLLMNGKVLFAGGNDTDPEDCSVAELYDPSNGNFELTGSTSVARGEVSATLLPDGTVLVAGSPWGKPLAGGELYDPDTGTFSNAGDMATDRQYHTGTLLNDGTVLITGGIHAVSPCPACSFMALPSAEIYRPPVLTPAPVLLSLSGDGRGQGAILHASTQQLVSADNPAVAGDALEIFLTGLNDGSVIPPQVAIGGRMAEILFFGKAPGFDGLNQVNVRVPTGVVPGPAVPVRLNYIGRPSNEVIVFVQH
jgi:hypothetical protein